MEYQSLIYKANKLTRAEFRLNLNAQRLILACIAQIQDPRKIITDSDEFVITAHGFSRLFGTSKDSAYYDLKEAAKELTTELVIIDNPDPENPKLSRTHTGWAESANYYDGDGKVVIRFRRSMIPYLSNLKDGCFSKYRIERIARIKSVVAIRIYEILISESWLNKAFEIEISALRKILKLDPRAYERIFDFKRFIIEPSVKSINEHTDCSVKASYKKTGRIVTHVVFNYTVEKTRKPIKITKPYIEKHAKPGESYDQARIRLSAEMINDK